VASIPIPGGRSLRPVENRVGSFDKVADQNFPHISFNPPYFSICTFNKKNSPYFFSPIFHWANYTLNKTFSLDRKKAQNGGENLSQKLGEPQPKTGGKL